jgi:D-alanyl-D-alanine carboxypeptidase
MLQNQRATTMMRTIAATTLLLLAVGCGGSNNSEPLPAASTQVNSGQTANVKVDDFVQSELKRQNIPGLALVVQQDGKVIYAKGYGYANLDQAMPATADQRFQIGSISKQFSAAAVMLLVEDGKMALDDKIGRYLGAVPPEWDAITVRHLLTHTSGLPHDLDPALEAVARTHGAYTTEEIIAILKGYKPVTTPGAAYAYSNTGYLLMGVIIEKVTGSFYGDIIQNRIFKPLGMTTARVIEFHDLSGNATGYRMVNNKLTALDMFNMPAGFQVYYRGGAGGIEMSALDLAKWDASLSTEKILKKSSIDQMWTPAAVVEKATDYTINYGLGWFISDYRGHPKVYHSGGMAAFTTDYLRYTNDKLTVIVLTNLGMVSDPEKISRTVANMYVPGILPAQ